MEAKTVAYLTGHLRSFVRPGERVLICLEKGGLCGLMEQAVACCGGRPVLWGEDRRWKQLLRLAFSSRATTIIGTPLILLGLSKLKQAKHTPLFIRNVVTAGYPCYDWMLEGIVKGFDCRIRGCFGLDTSGVVAGFSCNCSRGVHLRSSEYSLEVVDGQGKPLPEGAQGRWVLWPADHPELRYSPGELCRLDRSPCPCGDPSPRILDLRSVDMEDNELSDLAQYLLSWTSVLDFTLNRGPYGLEIQLIYFPGEKLPTLPSCARQVVRPWDPEKDEPFPYEPGRKYAGNFPESH